MEFLPWESKLDRARLLGDKARSLRPWRPGQGLEMGGDERLQETGCGGVVTTEDLRLSTRIIPNPARSLARYEL